MPDSLQFFLAGRRASARLTTPILNKHTGEPIAQVALADAAVIEQAIAAAVQAASQLRRTPAFQRQAALQHVVDQLAARQAEFAQIISAESGKPVRDARSEVARALDTFRLAAEESTRLSGEYLPLDISERAAGAEAIVKHVPIGPCSFITPFNFPLNLCAHKVAPAIACGCPFILKPAPQTPITALLLGEILAQTDLPAGSFSILPCTNEDAAPLVEHERIKLLSFTGSAAVGWMLKAKAGKKKVVLELGGNAACIVDANSDVNHVCERVIFGAFYQSGQSCISVQRLLIHESLYAPLATCLVASATKLKSGDPNLEDTFLGPLISENDAKRIEQWVNEAVQAGAKILCGGKRNGVFYDATILENVASTTRISCEEAFGPVLIIEPFTDFARACESINRSRYGLQAGVFTANIHHAWHAFNELEVGGVIINDVPAFRVDSMPYGGVKDSGLGREGVRYAIHEMTELRTLVIKRQDLRS